MVVKTGDFQDLDLIDRLISDAKLVLPIVSNYDNFKNEIPTQLRGINGFELSGKNAVESLVSCILEGLSLLRLARKLFISYKRDESSTVAIQLFENLEKSGFDVFSRYT